MRATKELVHVACLNSCQLQTDLASLGCSVICHCAVVDETVSDILANIDEAINKNLDKIAADSATAALDTYAAMQKSKDGNEGGEISSPILDKIVTDAISSVKSKQAQWLKDGFRPVSSMDQALVDAAASGAKDTLVNIKLSSGYTPFEVKHVFEKSYDAAAVKASTKGLSKEQAETAEREAKILASDGSAASVFEGGKIPVKAWQYSTNGLH